jgi:ketosteroid isomerase-like protein
MSDNKRTVERYMEGFRHSDHTLILSCLTDDVVWDILGFAHLEGKAQFDREIENDAFVGSPSITITRLVEENGIVVAEGEVRAARRAGGMLHAVFCDVFEMERGLIRRLHSYLVPLPDETGLA